ncbi:MAG: DUF3853 family protein [Muribaculaceae bacterium]
MTLNSQQIVFVTTEQLQDFATNIVRQTIAALRATDELPDEKPKSETKYCYGLHGIMSLFNVSVCTAQRYKNTFLQPAVIQRGHKIMVDVEKALQLYNEYQQQ